MVERHLLPKPSYSILPHRLLKMKGSASTAAPAATPRASPRQPRPLDKMARQNKLLDKQGYLFGVHFD